MICVFKCDISLIDGEQMTASKGGSVGVEGLSKMEKDSWTWTTVW